MLLLAEWKFEHNGEGRNIELYLGDLSDLPPEHAVDILVVSAFPNDYIPTPSSLIGALFKKGISVEQLAMAKERDLRKEFSCWLSAPLMMPIPFRRLLCIESGWHGTPPEIADDLFRVLVPCALTEFPNGSVAMPLIGAGDQGYPPDQIMTSILRAAIFWYRRGLDLRTLKIVVRSEQMAALAQKSFQETRAAALLNSKSITGKAGARNVLTTDPDMCEVFLSYSHSDSQAALSVVDNLRKITPNLSVFYDREKLTSGTSWLMKIAESLDAAKCVVALFTPDYWKSNYCKDEFAAAYMRQRDSGKSILFPVYLNSAPVPYMFRTIQFEDCREGDHSLLMAATARVASIWRP